MKILVITGSAACVHEDIKNIGDMMQNIGDMMPHRVPDIPDIPPFPADFMAIGLDAVDKYDWPVLYVATYHPEKIEMTRQRRESIHGNTDYKVICHESKPGVDIVIKDWWTPSGSSALLGVQAGMRMGYKRIILCGCPLTGKNSAGSSYETFRQGFNARQKEIAPFVRSMSGWTRDLLGKPTPEWLMEAL